MESESPAVLPVAESPAVGQDKRKINLSVGSGNEAIRGKNAVTDSKELTNQAGRAGEKPEDDYKEKKVILTPGERESIATMAWASLRDNPGRPNQKGKYMYRTGPTPGTDPKNIKFTPYAEGRTEKPEPPKKPEGKIAPRRSEKETQDLIFGFVEQSARGKRKKLIATIKEMEKLMQEVREGRKELIPGKPDDNEAPGIIQDALKIIKTDDKDYLEAFRKLKDPENYIRTMKRELAEAYKDENLEVQDIKDSISHSVDGRFDEIAYRNPIANEMLYLADDIRRGRMKVIEAEAGPEEKRLKLIEEIVSSQINLLLERENGQESSAYDIIKRHSKVQGFKLSEEEIREIIALFTRDRENVVKGASVLVENELREKNLPHIEEKITGSAFITIRSKLIEYLNNFLASRRIAEPHEESKEIEEKFSPEQMEILNRLVKVVNRLWESTLKESASWSGAWNEDRVRRVFEPAAEANVEEALSARKFPEELRTDAVKYVISKYQNK